MTFGFAFGTITIPKSKCSSGKKLIDSDKKRICYLPITKYKRNPNREQQKKERVFFDENRKFSGERRAHVRLLQDGHKASKFQLILAMFYNILNDLSIHVLLFFYNLPLDN